MTRVIKNIKLSSFKNSENIQKKEGGPDSIVSNNQFSSVTLNELAMNARKRVYYNFEFQRGSQTNDCYKSKNPQFYYIEVGRKGNYLTRIY